jgi:hypothetical protein
MSTWNAPLILLGFFTQMGEERQQEFGDSDAAPLEPEQEPEMPQMPQDQGGKNTKTNNGGSGNAF